MKENKYKHDRLMSQRPLSSHHPILYWGRVKQRQLFRFFRWHLGAEVFATQKTEEPLRYRIYRHQSKLRRYLSDVEEDKRWQDNKVHNHAIALPLINGIIIQPGETFSFWRLVGRPTARRGFREGMELSKGKAQGGIGGGLCQIGNLLHWIALHSQLEVTSRASHSFDPFPDQGRVIPYGTGAALFYNYVDLWLHNPTNNTFQIRLWMTDKLLNGELRADGPSDRRHHIYEKNAGFEKHGKKWIRRNEIWRETIRKGQGREVLSNTMLYSNRVRVMYEPTSQKGASEQA